MTELIGGVVPLNNLLAGISADSTIEIDPSGDLFARFVASRNHTDHHLE
jgi:hypothetical protein